MNRICIFIITMYLSACNSSDKTSQQSSLENNHETSTKAKSPSFEYPLVNFFYTNNQINADKHQTYYPEGITDLIVDSSNGNLSISFDKIHSRNCQLIGKIDRHLHWEEEGVNDTIYLEYYQKCNEIDTNNKGYEELRLYYQITDALSYKRAVFIPRAMEQK